LENSIYNNRVSVTIASVGALNIAEGQVSGGTGYLSGEYVLEQNPYVILKTTSGTNGTLTALQGMRDEILSREELAVAEAVTTGRVCVFDSRLYSGMRNPIGMLFMAKWIYPELFTDVDPEAVQQELYQQFLGETLEGVWAYP
jgi:iron complex transport system substrate-binding protein